MFTIRPCSPNDVTAVLSLEKRIEGDNAASQETLQARQAMFSDGFLLAKKDDEIVGYVQSCIWQRPDFETFGEIRSFPDLHTSEGNELYVIFLATAVEWRKQGIAKQLLQSLKDVAKDRRLQKMSLVAKDALIGMYQKSGFHAEKPLPRFLPQTDHTLMSLEI